MKLDTLAGLVGAGATTAMLLEAVGQGTVQVPPDWNPTDADEAGVCGEPGCGLLMVALPTPVRTRRVQVCSVTRTSRSVLHDMTHAHAVMEYGGQWLPVCMECWDSQDGPCPHHLGEMCDTPNPELCNRCADAPALPGGEDPDQCRAHQPYEMPWDKDRYLGVGYY